MGAVGTLVDVGADGTVADETFAAGAFVSAYGVGAGGFGITVNLVGCFDTLIDIETVFTITGVAGIARAVVTADGIGTLGSVGALVGLDPALIDVDALFAIFVEFITWITFD